MTFVFPIVVMMVSIWAGWKAVTGPARWYYCVSLLVAVVSIVGAYGVLVESSSYPHFWRFASKCPSMRDLAGSYHINKLVGLRSDWFHGNGVQLQLNEAGTLIISGLHPGNPGWAMELNPNYTRWKLVQEGGACSVVFAAQDKGWANFTRVVDKSPNLKLWTVIGDPDNHEGIEFSRDN